MLLEAHQVVKKFGGITAVDGVDLHVEENEILGIIGPNGAGKTTLFNLISGALPVTEGTINFNGEQINGLKPHIICNKGVGRTYQVVKPFENISVIENVMVGAFNKINHTQEARQFSEDVLKKVRLFEKKDLDGSQLTLAEKKRLEVARALATKPKLLLLDEVMAGLNPSEIKEILPLIQELKEDGITIIVIEHIMEVIMNVSDRIVVIQHGKKIAEGTPDEVSNNEEVIKAYLGEEISLA